MKFYSVIQIDCETEDEALQVLAQRLLFEAEYGFNYEIDWSQPVEQLGPEEKENVLGLLQRADDVLAKARIALIASNGQQETRENIDALMREIAPVLRIREHRPDEVRDDPSGYIELDENGLCPHHILKGLGCFICDPSMGAANEA